MGRRVWTGEGSENQAEEQPWFDNKQLSGCIAATLWKHSLGKTSLVMSMGDITKENRETQERWKFSHKERKVWVRKVTVKIYKNKYERNNEIKNAPNLRLTDVDWWKEQKLVWHNGGFTERDEEILEGKTLSVIIRMLLLRWPIWFAV